MTRNDILNAIGPGYQMVNLEQSDEFSYVGAGIPLKKVPKIKNTQSFKLDMRFEDPSSNLSVLVETMNINPSRKDWSDHENKLLNSYLVLEQMLKPNNNIILILAESGTGNRIKVWQKENGKSLLPLQDTVIKGIDEYSRYFVHNYINDELRIKEAVLELNELLHKNGIKEDIRGQFVGTCLLALKANESNPNSFQYDGLQTPVIISGIKNIIGNLLQNDINRATKIVLLDTKVLNDQKVRTLKNDKFIEIINFIKNRIIPYINPKTNKGQDLLNLFFTTFNKYVGKADKNQAFTPDHITHFMCKVAGINKNSRVLDPTCGSGSFIVQALIQELNECQTEAEKDNVRKNNIYGIENEEKAYGLSTTNMLIHGDGNSNVVLDLNTGCFAMRDWIQNNNINVVLMNPPYNAKPIDIPKDIKNSNNEVVYTIHGSNWTAKQENGKADPSKGFCFVNYIADCIGKNPDGTIRQGAKLLCLLPLTCAIGSKKPIAFEKERILKNNTLDAVFTLPPEMFYPGANVNACCMVFTIGISHYTRQEINGVEMDVPRKETFLGYYKDDGFTKKKNLGRISRVGPNGEPLWESIEKEWMDLFLGNTQNPYMGIKKKLTHNDEWLAEAYIETNYSKFLSSYSPFEMAIRQYLAYLITKGYSFPTTKPSKPFKLMVEVHDWSYFKIKDLFHVELATGDIKEGECLPGETPLISSGTLNNGVVEYIDEIGDGISNIFGGNKITVDMFGQSFYQPDDFFSVSHGRVNVLNPYFDGFNKYHGLFIATVLNNEKYRFSYNRACYSGVIEELKIKLPSLANEDGKPEVDWDFIERFMKSLNYSDLI